MKFGIPAKWICQERLEKLLINISLEFRRGAGMEEKIESANIQVLFIS